MAKAHLSGTMEDSTRDSGKQGNRMGLGCTLQKMETEERESGSRERDSDGWMSDFH